MISYRLTLCPCLKTYNAPSLLIILYINLLIKRLEVVVFTPYFGVFELLKGVSGDELPCA